MKGPKVVNGYACHTLCKVHSVEPLSYYMYNNGDLQSQLLNLYSAAIMDFLVLLNKKNHLKFLECGL